MDQIHDRLQKLISQLEILGESLSQEDINLKFLRSLPTEPTTQNIAFVSSQNTDSTNESVSAVTSVSATSTTVQVFFLPNVDNLSDAVIYSFFASQSNSPQLDNDDLKQINADDLEEIDLKCVMVLVAMIGASSQMKNQQTMPSWHSPPQVLPVLIMRKSQFDVLSYKIGLESVEARIVVYQQNENVFEEDIKLLKLDVMLRDNALVELRKKFRKAEQERDDLKLKLENFQTSSKNLSKLLGSQITDKTGISYDNQVFNSTVFDCDDLISSESDVSMSTSPVYDSPTKPNKHLSQSNRPSAPIIKDWVSNSEDEYEGEPMPTQKAPSFVQTPEHVKNLRPSVKPVEYPIPAENLRKDIPKSRGHRHSWNRKACFMCKSLTHLITDCDYYEKKMIQKPIRNHAMRGHHQHYARMTHPHPHRHVVPTSVLTRSRLVPLTAARPVTTAVTKTKVQHQRPTKHGVTKAHSLTRRPINLRPTPTHSNFHQKVTTVKATQGNPQHALKDKGFIESGFSRHITGNIFYLCDFEKINGGYVAFGVNPKGGKIIGKDKMRLGKLDFDDVYFVKELKFNLFSVSQMCDKKNSVLFTYTEFIFLSSDFKLPDANHVLLRIPRENNMYNVNLKNIVRSGDLTCLFEKAILDESNFWHRRLGHINFKTMNKLVKGNLVRGIPSKVFENPHTYVACKKGKQHRASCKTKPNKVLVTKPHNKIPYELLLGRTPSIGFMRDFGCPVTILNTLDPLDKAGEGNVQQYVLFPLWSTGSKDPQNTDADATFEVKEPKSEAMFLQAIVPRQRNMMTRLKERLKERVLTNGVNAASTPVTSVEPNSTNSTNTFSAAGPSNNAVSSRFKLGGKSSYVDPSQYPDDPDMPALEDITYSDDEEDVGAEADFSISETNITEEGIDYEEVFAPVTRIEAIRLFLAYASFMGFMVYQMHVKSDFLYETIEEEVYVCQPPRFEDPDYIDKVYKVVKALYGLHQAPRAWYETLANYLLENGFERGKIDQTLFIKKQKGDILLVQVYVDDIIFGSTNKDLCKAFEKLMKDKFQMSLMGELTLFLGLQVKQKQDGIVISHDKYVAEILRKFGLTDGKSASTPIDIEKPLLKDPDGEDVDVHTYRSMIGSLMYLTSSRPDIMFAVCACAHFHVTPKASHLHAVKKILGVNTPRCDEDRLEVIELMGFLVLGFKQIIDFLNTSVIQSALMVNPTIYVSCIKQFWSSVLLKKTNDVVRLQALIDKRKVIITEDTVRARRSQRLQDLVQVSGMLVPQQVYDDVAADVADDVAADVADTDAEPTLPSPTLATTPPPQQELILSSSQEDASKQVEKITEIDADEDVTLEEVNVEKDVEETDEIEPAELKEVLEVVTAAKLMTKVVTIATTPITATPVPKASALRRRRVVIIKDPEEAATASLKQDEAFVRELEAELNANINWNEVIKQVKRKEKQDNTVIRCQALKRKPVTEAHARKNMMLYLKNMAGFKMDFFKGMSYTNIRPIFEKHFTSNWAFLEKGEKEEKSKQSKRKGENLKQKAAKKQKIDEEVEELKTHLQIIPNDEDDVYTEATPLALKNFDREDLEMLWKIVQERFASSEPKNFSDDFLLNALKTIFRKPNVEDNIWKN
nr:putative ribonuclease H-like domain-containing protein [Tanacetum cinerariifolium]